MPRSRQASPDLLSPAQAPTPGAARKCPLPMAPGSKLRFEPSSGREVPATGAGIVRKGWRRRRESFGSVFSQLRLSLVEVFERRRTWRSSIASSLYLTRLLQDLEVDPL